MNNKQRVDSLSAPLLAEFEKMKASWANDMDVNEKMKNNQIKLEEQLKIEVAKNVTLETENKKMKDQLATKDEIIKVLKDDSKATIKQLEKKLDKLTNQLEASRNGENSAKRRKQATSTDENSSEVCTMPTKFR